MAQQLKALACVAKRMAISLLNEIAHQQTTTIQGTAQQHKALACVAKRMAISLFLLQNLASSRSQTICTQAAQEEAEQNDPQLYERFQARYGQLPCCASLRILLLL